VGFELAAGDVDWAGGQRDRRWFCRFECGHSVLSACRC
jgi:hypothetical protein